MGEGMEVMRACAMLTVEAAIFEPRLGHIEAIRPRPVLLERVAPTQLPYNAHALRTNTMRSYRQSLGWG